MEQQELDWLKIKNIWKRYKFRDVKKKHKSLQYSMQWLDF